MADGAEFKHAWMELPTYYYITVDRVRMLLEAVDRKAWTPLSEKVKYGDVLTIEHLMPQKWADYYPLPDSEPKEVATVTRNRVIHTMGNLALLTQNLNPKVSNGAWLDKRAEILEHSALALNRRLEKWDTWTEKEIAERAAWMAGVALKTWPIPANPNGAG